MNRSTPGFVADRFPEGFQTGFSARQSLAESADLMRRSGWCLCAVHAPEFDTPGCDDDGDLFSPCVTTALFKAGRRQALEPTIDWLNGRKLKALAQRY